MRWDLRRPKGVTHARAHRIVLAVLHSAVVVVHISTLLIPVMRHLVPVRPMHLILRLTCLHHIKLVLFRDFLRQIADTPKFSNRRLGKETMLVAAAARGNGVIIELTQLFGVLHLSLDEAAVILLQFWLMAASPL